jgi:F420H(2)-dependent quinone reductase
MPSDFALKAVNTFHPQPAQDQWWPPGMECRRHMPVLGAHDHRPQDRSAPLVILTSLLQDGSTIVVVASRGGDDEHPAWCLNLRPVPARGLLERPTDRVVARAA